MEKQQLSLNHDQCRKTGSILKSLSIRPSFFERRFIKAAENHENWLNACYFAVAICHQTHKLYHPIRNLQGWNYLEEVFTDFVVEDNALIQASAIAKMSIKEVEERLCEVFTHDGYADHCTLDRLEERASLMKESAHFLNDHFEGSFNRLLEKSERKLFNKGKGLYEILEDTEAFSDPMRKKSSFLIKLLQDAGKLNIKDADNYIPIVDYHMQRVLLRLGCIEIEDKDLRKKLLHRKPMESDEAFRNLSAGAFKIIARESQHSLPGMNDFFWPLGRSCCHETTLCKEGFCSKNPCTFRQMVTLGDHNNCIFEPICKGAKTSDYRHLWQPVVQTHYY